MSLVVFAVIPFMIFNGWLQGKAKLRLEGGEVVGGEIVQENVNNIKTVRAMNTIKHTFERFDKV